MEAEKTLDWAICQLTEPHQGTIVTEEGSITGIEGALLLVLERAVTSDSGRGSAAGVARTGSPVDLTAMALWDKLFKETTQAWPGRLELARKNTHLVIRLRELAAATLVMGDVEAEGILLEWCMEAIKDIRNIVEPPRKTALRGTACPRCKNEQVLTQAPDGGEVFNPCLQVHLSEDPIRVECLVCESEWIGGDLLDLKAQSA